MLVMLYAVRMTPMELCSFAGSIGY